MLITRELVRDKLLAYLNHQITLSNLVDWAETAMCEGDLEEYQAEILRDIIARIGLADVQKFDLSWADCSDFLKQLGYETRVEAIPISA